MALYCSLEFFKAVKGKDEIAIGTSFTCPVTNFLANREFLTVAPYCSLEFFKAAISKAKSGIGFPYATLSPTSLAMIRY